MSAQGTLSLMVRAKLVAPTPKTLLSADFVQQQSSSTFSACRAKILKPPSTSQIPHGASYSKRSAEVISVEKRGCTRTRLVNSLIPDVPELTRISVGVSELAAAAAS